MGAGRSFATKSVATLRMPRAMMVMTMMHGRAAIIGHRQSWVTVVSFMFKGSILEINTVLVAISITCTIRRVTVATTATAATESLRLQFCRRSKQSGCANRREMNKPRSNRCLLASFLLGFLPSCQERKHHSKTCNQP